MLCVHAGGGTGNDTKPGPLDPLVRALLSTADTAVQQDILQGMCDALQGRRKVAMPASWPEVKQKMRQSTSSAVREKVMHLSVLFGDAEALAALHKLAANPVAPQAARSSALQALLEKRPEQLLPLLCELVTDPAVRRQAIQGLAAYGEPQIPAVILRHYASLNEAEKADAVATLASRSAFALALLDAIEKGRVPRRDVSPYIARQILKFHDPRIPERLNAVWGTLRPAGKDMAAQLGRYKNLTTSDSLGKADRSHGRLVFRRTCATCHTLFDDGGKIGPELTGSQRANSEYILTKVLDPSAVVPADYQVTVLSTTDGRTLSGVVKEENDKTLSLQTPTELVRLPKKEIEERSKTHQSLMPDGLLSTLTEVEVRDLLAYLAGPGQVPIPPGQDRP
jgi:putative heme-binding domain-containing protein